jgi:hypothetical protein
MEHVHYEFDAPAGAIIEVTVDRQANVLLLDPINYQRYRHLDRYDYRGGLALRSPVPLRVPSTGRWHIAIDLSGRAGHVSTAARLIR